MDPSTVLAGQAVQVRILGNHLNQGYSAWADQEKPVRAWFSDRELTLVAWDAAGTELTVEVPADLATGLHPVRVENPRGASVLEDGFRVQAP